MTIQPSLIIWTVICFCLFALVLNGLIIKPVLKVIDARKERLARAKAAKQAALQAAEDARLALEAGRAEAERAERDRLQTRLERLREQKEAEYAAYAAALREGADNNVREPEKLATNAEAAVEARMGDMVSAFAEKLLSGGKR